MIFSILIFSRRCCPMCEGGFPNFIRKNTDWVSVLPKWFKTSIIFWYGNHSQTDKDKTHPKTLIKTILQIPTLGRSVFKIPARTSFKWKVTFQHHERCEENLNLSQPGTSTSLADYDYMTRSANLVAPKNHQENTVCWLSLSPAQST